MTPALHGQASAFGTPAVGLKERIRKLRKEKKMSRDHDNEKKGGEMRKGERIGRSGHLSFRVCAHA